MRFCKKKPAGSLAAFIKHYWVMEIFPADIPYSQLYFPYGSFELIGYINIPAVMQYVGADKKNQQPSLFYSGQFTKPFYLHFDKPCKCYGISFQPWAGNLLYNLPANIFTNNMISLADLDRDNSLLERLYYLYNDEAVFMLLENYVLRHMQPANIDVISAAIVDTLIKSNTRKDVSTTIAGIGLCRRRIEQKFLAATGLTIGALRKKLMFQKAVCLIMNNNSNCNLTKVGYDAGFYDQSHFISTFKEYTAIAPLQFLKQQTDMKDFISSLLV